MNGTPPPVFHEGVLVNTVIVEGHGVIVVASTPFPPFFERVDVDIATSFETRYSYWGGGGYPITFLFFSPSFGTKFLIARYTPDAWRMRARPKKV
jgi:hypothetical protein